MAPRKRIVIRGIGHPAAKGFVGFDAHGKLIGAKLHLVHRQKVAAHAIRHRLDRADPIADLWRHDPFLAGDQRHHGRPAQRDDPVVNLARQ